MTDNEFHEFVKGIIKDYKGDGTKLINAVGALVVGWYVGWRVLSLVLSEPTFFKYQKTLGYKFKDILPERSVYTSKSYTLRVVDKLQNFWRVVKGLDKDKVTRQDRITLE